MTTQPSHSNASDISANVELTAEQLSITLRDRRPEPLTTFGELSDTQCEVLAADAWRIGLRAVMNADKQADEARLTDIGKSLREDLEHQVERLVTRQNEAVERVLSSYFDPKSGVLTDRLEAFTRDDGELMTRLREVIGPDQSMLAQTLAAQLGAESPLLRKLDPVRKDGLVHELGDAISKVLSEQRSETARMLDPLVESGPLARFFKALRTDLDRAENDRTKQLKLATAALDAGNPKSLLSRLVKETQATQVSFLAALNLASPTSPLAVIKTSLTQLLSEHIKTERERAAINDKRQRELDIELRATLARLETKKVHDARSSHGGRPFEQAVVDFMRRTFSGAAMTVEAVGNVPGTINRCRTGDAVARFTKESTYAGCGLVVEAKHDASYGEAKALHEMAEATKNHSAQAGVFVMARSHAPDGFPLFARHGTSVLVVWDEHDSATDAYLHAALLLCQCMAARTTRPRDDGNVRALAAIEGRIQDELDRLEKMQKQVDTIDRAAEQLTELVRKGAKALHVLMRNAKEVLEALEALEEPITGDEALRSMALGAFDAEAAAEE